MLAKQPEDRFQSMAEVQSALAAAVGLAPPPFPLSQSALDGQRPLQATVALPNLPQAKTTLSNAAGERSAPAVSATFRKGSNRWMIVVGVGTAAIAAIVAVALFGQGKRSSAPAVLSVVEAGHAPVSSAPAADIPAAPGHRRVRVHLESLPAGARIVREPDGVVLGTTPQDMELESALRRLRFRLTLDGYLPSDHDISLEADVQASYALVPDRKEEVRSGGKKHPAVRDHDEPAKM
jgi:hypothetical protein